MRIEIGDKVVKKKNKCYRKGCCRTFLSYWKKFRILMSREKSLKDNA